MSKEYEVYMKTKEEAEELSVEELEKLIEYHSEEYRVKKNVISEKLEAYLWKRKNKLNRAFEWTPENKEKLLCLNDKLIECFEKLKAEAAAVSELLQKRVDAQDAFLHDFEIEATVTPFFCETDENGVPQNEIESGIERVLMSNWKDMNLSFPAKYQKRLNDNLYFNRELNWNIEGFDGHFDEHYISYGIHELYDHTTGWSFPDILKINHLWAELKITHQHFTDV